MKETLDSVCKIHEGQVFIVVFGFARQRRKVSVVCGFRGQNWNKRWVDLSTSLRTSCLIRAETTKAGREEWTSPSNGQLRLMDCPRKVTGRMLGNSNSASYPRFCKSHSFSSHWHACLLLFENCNICLTKK